MDEPRPLLLLHLPGGGRWQVRNSPARRVPSHGTHLLGSTFAIDLVPVDARGRSGPITWRTLLATEDPSRFVGWGRPVWAPVAGVVALVHDGEPDGPVRRSPVAYPAFALTQGARVSRGVGGVAGNCVVITVAPGGPHLLVAHLRRGSVAVGVGDRVAVGQAVGQCGNSGNSTQPHVHLQVTDSLDYATARGLPLAFDRYRTSAGVAHHALPAEAEIIEAVVDS
ncbi:MAG: M23 family metallopeptidase [Micropruina sp.]|nr:M23 family metallopeptidase [Micropruina sp.]